MTATFGDAAGGDGGSGAAPTAASGATRFADYFAVVGLDLSSGLEPDTLSGDNLHVAPLSRPYKCAVLGHYPEKYVGLNRDFSTHQYHYQSCFVEIISSYSIHLFPTACTEILSTPRAWLCSVAPVACLSQRTEFTRRLSLRNPKTRIPPLFIHF